MVHATRRIAVVLTLVLLVTACGGGGGGGTTPPPPPASLFTGTYFYQAWAGNFGSPNSWSWWGDVAADGVSQVTGGTLDWNGAGVLGSGPVTPFPYTVDAARRIIWQGGGPFNMEGGISTGGGLAVLGSIGTGGWPSFGLVLRKSGTYSLASLNGTYHMLCMYGTTVSDYTWWGTLTFDGAGNVTETFTGNNNGSPTLTYGPTPHTYTVAPDGTVDLIFTPGNYLSRGGILPGGDLVVVSGGLTAGNPAYVTILIRASTSASTSTLSGGYHLVAVSADAGAPPPHFSSFTGTCTADGSNNITTNVGGILNIDGVVTVHPPAAIPYTYNIVANGALTIFSGGNSLVGAVSPGGGFACVAGGTAATSNPQLWFLVR